MQSSKRQAIPPNSTPREIYRQTLLNHRLENRVLRYFQSVSSVSQFALSRIRSPSSPPEHPDRYSIFCLPPSELSNCPQVAGISSTGPSGHPHPIVYTLGYFVLI